jgi:hypothetical protein
MYRVSRGHRPAEYVLRAPGNKHTQINGIKFGEKLDILKNALYHLHGNSLKLLKLLFFYFRA